MSIAKGQVIKASDVTARLSVVLTDLSSTLANYPHKTIFTEENYSNLATITSGSEFTSSVVQELLKLFNPVITGLNSIASGQNVLSERSTVLDGFCKLALSCYSLASNLRKTTIQYQPTVDGVTTNGMFLETNIINNSRYSEEDIRYNKGSIKTFETVSKYLDEFGNVPLDDDSIYGLSGHGTLSVNSTMFASDANKFIDFLSSLNCHIANAYPCLFEDVIPSFSVYYNQGPWVGDGSGQPVIVEVLSGTYFTIQDYQNLGWNLSAYGKTIDDFNFAGWTTNSSISSNPLLIDTPEYIPGTSILANDSDGEGKLTLYPVCHGELSIPTDLVKWNRTEYFLPNTNHQIKPDGSGSYFEYNFPVASISSDLSTVACFGHLSGWYNQLESSHTGTVKLHDVHANKQFDITKMESGGKGYQIFYNKDPNKGTVESHFKRGGGYWYTHKTYVECPELSVSIINGKSKFRIIFSREGTNGKDQFNGAFSGFYFKF